MSMERDPGVIKQQSLRLVRHVTERIADAKLKRESAIRLAAKQGATVEEIAEAAGLSREAVKQILTADD